MKNLIFKGTITTIMASAMAISMNISAAAASNSYESTKQTFSKTVSANDTSYVRQIVPNSFKPSTNIVLNSEYYRSGTKYSLSTYYGCQPWGPEYKYRFARVRTLNSKGDVIESEYNYKEADDVVSSAHLDDKEYSSKIAQVDFFGKSTIYNNPIYGLSGDCEMSCTFTLQ